MGTLTLSKTPFTSSSIPHINALTVQDGVRWWSAVDGASGSNSRYRASGFVFLESAKLKWVMNKAHLTYWELSLLANRMYCRFLWSVQTKNGCSVPSATSY